MSCHRFYFLKFTSLYPVIVGVHTRDQLESIMRRNETQDFNALGPIYYEEVRPKPNHQKQASSLSRPSKNKIPRQSAIPLITRVPVYASQEESKPAFTVLSTTSYQDMKSLAY